MAEPSMRRSQRRGRAWSRKGGYILDVADGTRAGRHGRRGSHSAGLSGIRLETRTGRGATTFGRRRGPSRGVRLTITVIVLAAIVGLAGWTGWRLISDKVLPASLTVRAMPADASISTTLTVIPPDAAKDAAPSKVPTCACGELCLRKVAPGTYLVTVARKGFETTTVACPIARGDDVARTIELKPQTFKVAIRTEPAGAAVTVTRGHDKPLAKKSPCEFEVAAGNIAVRVTASGRNDVRRAFFLDEASDIQMRLDPKGQLLHNLAIFGCGPAPKGVAITPDGKEAWIAMLGGPPSVEVYDPATGRKLSGIDLGKDGAVEIAFSKDGSRAYASQMETAKVFEIDTRTKKVLRTFKTESAWTKVVLVSRDGTRLWAANWSGNDVSEFDLATGKLTRRLPTVNTPRGLWESADGKWLYVAGFGHGDLDRISLANGSRKTIFKSGGALRHLVGDDATGRLFASDMAKDCVWVTDLKTGTTKRFAKVDHKPNTIDLSPDGRVLFVSCRGANNPKTYYIPGYEWGSVVVLDARSAKPLDAIVGGNQCTALDLSADGKVLIFSDFLDNRMRSYAVPDYATLAKGGGGRYAAHFADIKK